EAASKAARPRSRRPAHPMFVRRKERCDTIGGVPWSSAGAIREHDDRELPIRVLENRVGESGALTVMPQLWLAIHRCYEPAVAIAALLPSREPGRRPRALHRGAINERGVVERVTP